MTILSGAVPGTSGRLGRLSWACWAAVVAMLGEETLNGRRREKGRG
jgi:hypothetical protein